MLTMRKKKTPAESTRRGRRCPQTGGEAAGWCSCGAPFLGLVVRPQISGEGLEGLIPGVPGVLLLQVPDRPVGNVGCIGKLSNPTNGDAGQVHLDKF
jgi:hypothetical protein